MAGSVNFSNIMKLLGIYLFNIIYSSGGFDENQALIKMSELYLKYMSINQPDPNVINEINSYTTGTLKFTGEFIRQTITRSNELMSNKYLKLPDTISLKNIYILNQLVMNTGNQHLISN